MNLNFKIALLKNFKFWIMTLFYLMSDIYTLVATKIATVTQKIGRVFL